MTIPHARDIRKLARSRKRLYLLCPPDPYNLPSTALLSGLQSPRSFRGALKSTDQDSILSM